MNSSIYQSKIIFKLNGRLFNNALEGINEEQSKERITGHVNPVNWITSHTVWARYNTLMLLGKPADNPYSKLFENFKPYDASLNYPSLAEIKEEWKKVSSLLNDALDTVSEEHLASDSPLKSPIGDFTNAGTIAFLAQHESYDIGQLGLLKKYFTKEAMSYN
ncbi:MAG: DinB family protein [Ginsengibacter sp.]